MTQKYPLVPQNTGEVIIYQTADGQTSIDVKMENETVWLTQQQMSVLFQKDRTVIGRHIRNVFREGELDENITCAKFAHMGVDEDQVSLSDNVNVMEKIFIFLAALIVSIAAKAQSLLPTPEWKKGTAVVTGEIVGMADGDERKASVYSCGPLRSIVKNNDTEVAANGTFRMEVPVWQSIQPVRLSVPGFNGLVYVSPGEVTRVKIDAGKRRDRGKHGDAGSVVFSGANAELNNEMATDEASDIARNSYNHKVMGDYPKLAPTELKTEVMSHRAEVLASIESLDASEMTKELLRMEVDMSAAADLLIASRQQKWTEVDTTFYSFVNDLKINDRRKLLSDEFTTVASYCASMNLDGNNIHYYNVDSRFYRQLIESGELTDDERTMFEGYIRFAQENMPVEEIEVRKRDYIDGLKKLRETIELDEETSRRADAFQKKLESPDYLDMDDMANTSFTLLWPLFQKGMLKETVYPETETEYSKAEEAFYNEYSDKYQEFYNKHRDKWELYMFLEKIRKSLENIETATGISEGIIPEIVRMSAFFNLIDQDKTPLTDGQFAEIRKTLPRELADFLEEQNAALLEQISKTTSNVNELSPDSDGDRVLAEIAEKFRGRVILIDNWGTWCGPCMAAIADMAEQKKALGPEPVFVYLADPSSPREKWQTVIGSIHGEHFYLTRKQHEEIFRRFNFDSYPSYIIIGKSGEIVFTGNDHVWNLVEKIKQETEK